MYLRSVSTPDFALGARYEIVQTFLDRNDRCRCLRYRCRCFRYTFENENGMKAVQMLPRGNGNFDKKGRTGRATQADFKGNGACSMGRTLFRVLDRAMSCDDD
jgi:hypothetical protein